MYINVQLFNLHVGIKKEANTIQIKFFCMSSGKWVKLRTTVLGGCLAFEDDKKFCAGKVLKLEKMRQLILVSKSVSSSLYQKKHGG